MKPHLHKTTIDSFKIRIPIDKVTITDSELNQILITVNETTGERIGTPELRKKKYIDDDRKIKITFQIESIRDNKAHSEYLTIKVTSKLLTDNYFQGITPNNIKQVYNTIQSFGVAIFTFDDFINSSVTDIDFKTDFKANQVEYKELLTLVLLTAKDSIYQGKGIRTFNKKNNTGFQFSDRRTATPSNPYFKIYNKEIEMNTKSKDFKELYITDDTTDLHRLEFTLKDKKHLAKYGIDDNRLENLLNLDDTTKQMMLNDIWDYQVYNIKPIKLTDDTTDRFTTKDVLLIFIQMMLERNFSKGYILKRFLNNIESRATRKRYENMIIDCFKEIDKTNPEIVNVGAEKILSNLGINPIYR